MPLPVGLNCPYIVNAYELSSIVPVVRFISLDVAVPQLILDDREYVAVPPNVMGKSKFATLLIVCVPTNVAENVSVFVPADKVPAVCVKLP